jgi:hypothetical protein
VTPSVIAAHAHATVISTRPWPVPTASGSGARRPPTGSWRKAVRAAVDDVATHAMAFTPTTVSLREAKLAGDRIYLLVLLADRVGEEGV